MSKDMSDLNIKINVIGGVIIAFSIGGLWLRLESSLSSVNESIIRVQENTKETNNIKNEIGIIRESTKEINAIKSDVHDLLYNQRERQAVTALRKATIHSNPKEEQAGIAPESITTFDPSVLANLSIENKLPQSNFNQAVGILTSKPFEKAKSELKKQNLFTEPQIEKIFKATEEPRFMPNRGK